MTNTGAPPSGGFDLHLPPLLDGGADSPAPSAEAKRAAPQRSAAAMAARARRERVAKFIGLGLAAAGVIAGAAMAWDRWRPIVPPDTFNDPFDDVIGFALLDADFNRLPIEERIAIMKEMAERFRTMGSSDSALVAAFAAGITGKARETLERNMQVLMVDVVDRFAAQYAAAAPGTEEEAIEKAMTEMIGLMQELRTDNGEREEAGETLDDIRRQSARNDARRRERSTASVGAGDVSNVFQWVQDDVNQASSPNERARVTRFMRDAGRYLRGQDIRTGKPKGQGAGNGP